MNSAFFCLVCIFVNIVVDADVTCCCEVGGTAFSQAANTIPSVSHLNLQGQSIQISCYNTSISPISPVYIYEPQCNCKCPSGDLASISFDGDCSYYSGFPASFGQADCSQSAPTAPSPVAPSPPTSFSCPSSSSGSTFIGQCVCCGGSLSTSFSGGGGCNDQSSTSYSCCDCLSCTGSGSSFWDTRDPSQQLACSGFFTTGFTSGGTVTTTSGASKNQRGLAVNVLMAINALAVYSFIYC